MKGLELSEEFYRNYGEPLLKEMFPDIMPYIATGLCGSGSECLGYDDDVSADHDFEPGFCIFLPGEDIVDRKLEFRLERAYAGLPKEYSGYKRSPMNPVGGNRHGVIRSDRFFTEKTGTPDGMLSTEQWLKIPEYSLLEATNGKIYHDGDGKFSKIRQYLSAMPEDVRKKRLAGALLIMAQSGQYNYSRCIKHNETAAAQLAVFEFVKAFLKAAFLLNKRYMPYYKWAFRALRDLPLLSAYHDTAELLLTTENSADMAEAKYYMIEDMASAVITVLQDQDLTDAICADLEKHAYSVNDKIKDPGIRNLHILFTE